jgi:hypothetical protein
MDWIDLGPDTEDCRHLLNVVMNLQVPSHWVTGIFHGFNSSDPGVKSTVDRNGYQGYRLRSKGGRCVGLTTLPPSCTNYLEILVASTSWIPVSRPVMGEFYIIPSMTKTKLTRRVACMKNFI